MRKVLMIGCSGAGKSTFARRLHQITGLPLHHLDLIWHRPDRTNLSRAELDPEFRAWIEGFAAEQLPQIYRLLGQTHAAVTVFHTRAEAEAYLNAM